MDACCGSPASALAPQWQPVLFDNRGFAMRAVTLCRLLSVRIACVSISATTATRDRNPWASVIARTKILGAWSSRNTPGVTDLPHVNGRGMPRIRSRRGLVHPKRYRARLSLILFTCRHAIASGAPHRTGHAVATTSGARSSTRCQASRGAAVAHVSTCDASVPPSRARTPTWPCPMPSIEAPRCKHSDACSDTVREHSGTTPPCRKSLPENSTGRIPP